MKLRFFIVAIIVSCLILILVGGVTAHGMESNSDFLTKSLSISARADSTDIREIAILEDYLPSPGDFYIFLPLLLNNYPTCTLAPTLISPIDGGIIDTLVPTLTFERYNDSVTQTVLKIDDNNTFDSSITYGIGGSSVGVINLKLFNNLELATTYYWYTYDVCGSVSSPSSSVFSFTSGSEGVILPAPTLLSPPDGSIEEPQLTTFTWDSVEDAVGYQFYRCPINNGCTLRLISSTSTEVSNLLPDTEYTWYVKAYNDYAYGDQSAIWQFTTGSFTLTQDDEFVKKLNEPYLFYHSLEGPLFISELQH